MTQIAIVILQSDSTKGRIDKGLYYNGAYIASADADWKNFESIEMLAENLAEACKTEVIEINHNINTDTWRWIEVTNTLSESGLLQVEPGLGEWSVNTNVDSDGHLSIFVSHADESKILEVDEDIGQDHEWAQRLTTAKIEKYARS